MEFKTKIIVSIAFIIGVPIWLKLGEINDKRFINRLEKVDPWLAKKSSWFFSKEKGSFSKYIVVIFIIILLLTIWVDFE